MPLTAGALDFGVFGSFSASIPWRLSESIRMFGLFRTMFAVYDETWAVSPFSRRGHSGITSGSSPIFSIVTIK